RALGIRTVAQRMLAQFICRLVSLSVRVERTINGWVPSPRDAIMECGGGEGFHAAACHHADRRSPASSFALARGVISGRNATLARRIALVLSSVDCIDSQVHRLAFARRIHRDEVRTTRR